ncbi:ATPase AAA [Skermanella stibiiresistens SB22]|uniref:ATPase AAA n=1 Tax=Skermanella stibiiresistens SB22 TaxID=1385369 RepID=W9GZE0_9PROT|nr:phage shock protein operon transcriptional activator [Skermanella stibiiresistens]EWY39154.1 ATPase AAA [Skermanella stibiiresistens SB22]
MAGSPPDLPALMGESPAFQAMLEHVSKAAPLNKPTLVIGERGTGKELVAARLHYLSRRWDRPFVKLNCGALAESLLESELFGHEAGAFTGAVRRHVGRFELADDGTLFLDEIANAPPSVQEKMLRVIEYGEFERVGGSTTLATNVRLIGATNADLPALADRGRFRADLLDRLSFDVITIPPLRARPEDIPLLAEHFAVAMARELERPYFAGFTDRARALLLAHDWPGNVRELKNVVERAVYRAERPDRPVDTVVLDPFASPWRPAAPAGAPAAGAPVPAPSASSPPVPVDFPEAVRAFETGLLHAALERNQFNQKRAAAELGLRYHQFRGHLRKYGLLEDPPARAPARGRDKAAI